MANRIEMKLRPRGDFVRREATNSPLKIGSIEAVTVFVDFSNWGASASNAISSPVLKILDQDDNDKTTVMSTNFGGATIVNDTQYEFPLGAATQYDRYRVFVKVTTGGDQVEAWAYFDCEL